MNRTFLNPLATTKLAASIALMAKQALDHPAMLEEIPAGTEIYLPDMGSEDIEVTLKAACKLESLGFSAVPHLAARRAESIENVERRLRSLKEQAGVSKVLVIAGDQARPAGPFASSMDLLRSNLLEKHGFNDIRVAGHPEGSKDFSDKIALEALRAKIEFCERAGAKLKIVTQFGFDADAITRWCQWIRSEGIMLPIDLGVAGPASLTTLVKYAALCGVGASAGFLIKRSAQISSLLKNHTSEPLVRALENGQASGVIDNINAIHVFAFGGLRKSSEWLIERGSWIMGRGQ